MRVPILSGIKTDAAGDFRVSLPRNLLPVPVENGISKGYLRPADGIRQIGTAVGADRGGIRWKDECYRVSGTRLVKVSAGGVVTVLGDVGSGGPVSMTYSFDRLAIASGGRLYYYNGSALTQVTDHDLGRVLDVVWVAGYFATTDGESLVVTELSDPTAVDPLKYGSAESDPDDVMAIDEINEELYALNRFSIEPFENVAGTGFPYQRITNSIVSRGVIGTHAYCKAFDTFFFIGGGRADGGIEPPSIFVMTPGASQRIATAEVDAILRDYTEAELAQSVVEPRDKNGQSLIYFHLPDRCLVYDFAASKAFGIPVWSTVDSGLVEPARYRARGFVWCHDKWIAGDPTSSSIGELTSLTMEHHSAMVGWEFGTIAIYAGGNDGIVHELELVGLPGRVDFGVDPVIWTSYSHDGETWSQEKAVRCGKAGERGKRIAWRSQGRIRHYRMQKFRGTSDARVSFAALEMQIEQLQTRPTYG